MEGVRQEQATASAAPALVSVHACVLDATTLAHGPVWCVDAEGGMQPSTHDLGFAEAMARIVQHHAPAGPRMVLRQLLPQRWALGWYLDARHVIVVELLYAAACAQPADAELAQVRLHCEAQAHVALPAGAPLAAAVPARPGRRRTLLAGAGVVGGVAVLGAAGGLVLHRYLDAQAAEAARLQALSDATLVRGLAASLDSGDYGDLQAALDRLGQLRHFEAAVVANTRGQVVALSGVPHGARIGEVLQPAQLAGSRAIALQDGAGQPAGRLYVWAFAGRR